MDLGMYVRMDRQTFQTHFIKSTQRSRPKNDEAQIFNCNMVTEYMKLRQSTLLTIGFVLI